jgi:hypothetical protein
MMTTREAIAAAATWVDETQGLAFAVCPDAFLEDESFFVFCWNTKEFLESNDLGEAVVGQGPTILEKRDGRVFEYGSAVSMDEALALHKMRSQQETVIRAKFPHYDMRKLYRVFIRKIHDRRRLLQRLDSFGLSYVIPRIEGGVIWRVSKVYDDKVLKKRLSETPPVVFGYAGEAGRVENLYRLLVYEHCSICEIDIEEFQQRRKTFEPSKATPGDLAPEW